MSIKWCTATGMDMATAARFNSARLSLVAAVALTSGMAHADRWLIDPYVAVSETYSTNMLFNADTKLTGLITDVAPGVRIYGVGSRVKANVDYRLDNTYYEGHSQFNQSLNSLVSNGTINALDSWLYVDGIANIEQRNVSAFSARTADPSGAPRSRTETTTVQLSPYIRGMLSDGASYQLRYAATQSNSSDASLANTKVNQWIGSLKNASAGARIGWSLDGNVTHARNSIIGSLEDDRVRGAVTYQVVPQATVTVSDGQERTNFASSTTRDLNTPGYGVNWAPSPQTQATAVAEKRFFGTGHSVLLTHRTAWTAWQYSDTKDGNVLSSLLASSRQGGLDQLMSDLLLASIPDPLVRARAVRGFLDQTATVASLRADEVQTSRVFVDHTRRAVAVFLGRRETVTLSAARTDERAVTDLPNIIDSFGLAGDIRQDALGATWVHRMTRLTSLTASVDRLRVRGLGTNSDLHSDQSAEALSLSFELSPRSSASVGVRTVRFNSSVEGNFREHAVLGAFVHHFHE